MGLEFIYHLVCNAKFIVVLLHVHSENVLRPLTVTVCSTSTVNSF